MAKKHKKIMEEAITNFEKEELPKILETELRDSFIRMIVSYKGRRYEGLLLKGQKENENEQKQHL
jgi:hypothetical protein